MSRPRAAAATATEADTLGRYEAKRDFQITPEPKPVRAKRGKALSFVIQKHWASRLHYDFRLELDGVLISWALPKGPCFDPGQKRMAVHVEDHPVSYGGFEGTIPPKQYGAGHVIVWDRGTWTPINDPRAGLREGKLVFELHGHKLAGQWELVRIKKPLERQDPWLLFKKRDAVARPHAEYDVVSALPDSVVAKPLRAEADLQAKGEARAAAAREGVVDGGHKKPPAKQQAGPLPAGAAPAPLPAKMSPQLATLTAEVPQIGEWIFEVKFDGYRILTRIEGGVPRLFTRNGHDWTDKMPALARELAALGLGTAWLDGEAVVIGDNGVPSFNALQNAFDSRNTQQISYFLFDMPYFEGHDLRDAPLSARRELLRQLLEMRPQEHLRYSADFGTDAASVLQAACRLDLEGVIAKRADSAYRSTRSSAWLKLKCQQRQEFVVGGYTDRASATGEVGSLLLGVHDEAGVLRSVGSVGTGWDGKASRALYRQMRALSSDIPPFDAGGESGTGIPKRGRWTRRVAGSEHWVRPEVVVEVNFAEWTPDNQIRHASFVGVRSDKPAREITREQIMSQRLVQEKSVPPTTIGPAPAAAATKRRAPASHVGQTQVTHPERVIDPSTGLSKLDLVRYYESVADWMLPHLRDRPVSLVRGPGGIGGKLFFQKHGEKIGIPGIKELDAALWPGHEALLEVADAGALVGAAQMNVIEFHTWNSTTRHIDKPDRMVFDLDPGDGVAWKEVQEAALLTRAFLQQLRLESWLKTSGGKGLHVVVPLAPRWPSDTVKAFSRAVVHHLAKTIPARFVAKNGPANRIGKIFVDYLRNGHGATTAAAFSARARSGMGVSMPVDWEQRAELKSGAHWTIVTARDHLSFRKQDPWADYFKTRQALAPAMKTLGFNPARAP